MAEVRPPAKINWDLFSALYILDGLLTVCLCFCTGLSLELVRLSRGLLAAALPLSGSVSSHSVELRGRMRNVHSILGGLSMPPVKCSSHRFCFMITLLAVATSGRRSKGSVGCEADRAGGCRRAALPLGSDLNPLHLGDSSELLSRRAGGVEFVRSALGELKRGRCCC